MKKEQRTSSNFVYFRKKRNEWKVGTENIVECTPESKIKY